MEINSERWIYFIISVLRYLPKTYNFLRSQIIGSLNSFWMYKYVLKNFCFAFSRCRKWLLAACTCSPERERQQLPTFSLPKSSVSSSLGVDSKANAILNQCGIYNVGTPYKVYSDGGCLFDSVFVSLISTQDLSQELRVRACIDMIKMKDRVMSLPIASNLLSVAPNYINSVFSCAKQGGYSLIWTIFA